MHDASFLQSVVFMLRLFTWTIMNYLHAYVRTYVAIILRSG